MNRIRICAGVLAGVLVLAGLAHAETTGGTGIVCNDGICSLTTPVAFANGGTGLGAAADDTVMVSNGSAWQAKGVPDCDDSGGNHLNYDTATNTLTCGTSSGATIPAILPFGAEMGITTSKTAYLGAAAGVSLTELNVAIRVPAGTYGNLRCVNGPIQGNSNNIPAVVRSGSCGSLSDSSTTCTLTGSTSANAACEDVTNDVVVTDGECLTMKVTTPAALTNNARPQCTLERLTT